MTEMKVRALIGEWEGEGMVLLGAADYDVFENASEGNWRRHVQRWRLSPDWTGITDTKEVDITVSVPDDLFEAPDLEGAVVEEPNEQ